MADPNDTADPLARVTNMAEAQHGRELADAMVQFFAVYDALAGHRDLPPCEQVVISVSNAYRIAAREGDGDVVDLLEELLAKLAVRSWERSRP